VLTYGCSNDVWSLADRAMAWCQAVFGHAGNDNSLKPCGELQLGKVSMHRVCFRGGVLPVSGSMGVSLGSARGSLNTPGLGG